MENEDLNYFAKQILLYIFANQYGLLLFAPLMMNEVLITISNIKTGENYLARSYPDDDYNNNGKIELYWTPVYKVFLQNDKEQKEWKALRFMPYWNDPKQPYSKYKTRKWVVSGLSSHIPKKIVTYYDPQYGVQNRYSPYAGGIQIKDSFLIHAGPQSLADIGWGAAGCVEIIGDFDKFKDDIRILSGIETNNSHDAIQMLVKSSKLYVEVQETTAPNIKPDKWHKEIPRRI